MKSALDVIRVLEKLQVPKERLLLILNRATASGVALERPSTTPPTRASRS
jgi:hypothetical protein